MLMIGAPVRHVISDSRYKCCNAGIAALRRVFVTAQVGVPRPYSRGAGWNIRNDGLGEWGAQDSRSHRKICETEG